MTRDRENILAALRIKPLKLFAIMQRANISDEETCRSLLLAMREECLVNFSIHTGQWSIR